MRLSARYEGVLLRLRVLVLPLLTAVIAVGAGLATRLDRVSVPLDLSLALCIAGAVIVLALGVLTFLSAPGGGHPVFAILELLASAGLAVCFVVWTYFVWDRDPASVSIAAPVLVGGGFFLFVVYLVDRCLYSNLQRGASARTAALEGVLYWGRRAETDDRAGLSRDVSAFVPAWASALLPVVLYFVPILILMNTGLAVLAFGHDSRDDSAKCSVGITVGLQGGQLRFGLDTQRPSDLRGCIIPNLSSLPNLGNLLPGLLNPSNRR